MVDPYAATESSDTGRCTSGRVRCSDKAPRDGGLPGAPGLAGALGDSGAGGDGPLTDSDGGPDGATDNGRRLFLGEPCGGRCADACRLGLVGANRAGPPMGGGGDGGRGA